jgi:hypothetical protein
MSNRLAALVLAALLVGTTAPARAHGIDHLIDERRERTLPEVRRLIRLHEELHTLLVRYERLERRAGRAWIAVVDAERSVQMAEDAAREARARLAGRIRAVYQVGPGGAIEALLGAVSFADLARVPVYAEATFGVDEALLRTTERAEADLAALRTRALEERERLEPRLDRLRRLLATIQRRQDRAVLLAARASIEDQALRAQRRRIAEAAARQGTWDIIGYREDQGGLLALLGPTGGRTCDTPPGLAPTGEAFEGYASWYGWEFGGQPTATGAIFDPRLFTAANRWLPFGTFLRVHRGDRCAIVLLNDRGPYGHLERVIDLSMAAARYLGVGVSWVRAEILVPSAGVLG